MAATRFRAPPGDALAIVPLDEIVAVYHRASGITHLVAPPVPEILASLADGWSTTQALLEQLTRDYDMPDADEAALAARLEELVAAGLVERA